jgi:methylated-DNA-[protein]-cysteine S-methyltransferase
MDAATADGAPAAADKNRRHAVVPSPIGPLTLVADGYGAGASQGGALAAVYMEVHVRRPDDSLLGERVDPGPGDVLSEAARQLAEYFGRGRTEFELPLAPRGTPFQHRVWELLRGIPYGSTRSYGDLARELGGPRLTRAVGTANGRNPLSIVVPCHRVIGTDGSLTGFAGGLERKLFLLRLEGTLPSEEDQPPLF